MASNDFVNQLAKKSLAYKAMVLLGVLAFFGFFYYQFMYSGMVEEHDQLAQRKQDLVDKQAKLNKDLDDKKKLAEKNEELQEKIRTNQKALPTEAELPSFFDHLQRKAGDAGVSIQRWDRQKEKGVEIYIQVPVAMEITGSFYNIMRYFSLLGGSSRSLDSSSAASRVDERIVSIENLSLGTATLKDGEIVLTAKFVASTFRQQAAPEAPKSNKAKAKRKGAAGRAADKVEKAAKDRAKKVDNKSAAAK